MAHIILLRPKLDNNEINFDILVHTRSKDAVHAPLTLDIPGGSYSKLERKLIKQVRRRVFMQKRIRLRTAIREFAEEVGGPPGNLEEAGDPMYIKAIQGYAYVPKGIANLDQEEHRCYCIQHGKTHSFYYVFVLDETLDGSYYVNDWKPKPMKEFAHEIEGDGSSWVSLQSVFKEDMVKQFCPWVSSVFQNYKKDIQRAAHLLWAQNRRSHWNTLSDDEKLE